MPVPDALETALKVRRNPMAYHDDLGIFNCAETLGPEIQRFADVLEKELTLLAVGRKESACMPELG